MVNGTVRNRCVFTKIIPESGDIVKSSKLFNGRCAWCGSKIEGENKWMY